MYSARVNKAAILQRRQYLDPRVSYVQLNDQRKIKSLASSNGYVRPVRSYSHTEIDHTITISANGYYYISTDMLFRTQDGKFYVLKQIDTDCTGYTWYRSADGGVTFSDSSVDLATALYTVTFNNYLWCLTGTGAFFQSIAAGSFNVLRGTFAVGNVIVLTYEEATPVYGN